MAVKYRCPVCASACSSAAIVDPSLCKKCGGLSVEERFWAQVDRNGPTVRRDLGPCWPWTKSTFNHGYGQTYVHGERLAHRVAFKLSTAQDITGMEVDHICRNIICCRPTHLRATLHKQNCENKTALSTRTDSGYRGVRRRKNRWVAYFGHNGKTIYAGSFMTAEEAAEGLRLKRIELHTHNDEDRLENVQ